ncbi:6-pyruvoyl-tetrahydropterin synthase-related protein [Okeania sp. SIO3B5]|uniref:6-pyruvoyl-tetrahydropterin synthase-related protein n=1 Tax=Okeania sp. SIO3B5 TaxID=2607811 RepID=UPI0025DB75F9|nr:6-pyruvoyl-tetrahydropterin synthase-related protein [Okeania sp. SIO3B5]
MIRYGLNLNFNVDIKWHLTWIQHFSQQLSEGILYPRWLAGTNYGYGSPTFVFYPPLAYYLGYFLKLSGFNIQDTAIILFSSALFLSGLTFYIYGRNKWRRIPALAGALVYMTSPYIAHDIYYRGGLSSIFVQALIPLLWWLTEQSFSGKKWRLGLAICWTIIALTHTPSLLLCAIVWLFYTLFFLLNKPWKAVVEIILSAGVGLGMASFYLLPAILEKRFVNIEVMKQVAGGVKYNIFNLTQLFSLIQNNHEAAYIFLHQFLAIAVLIIIAFVFCRRQSPILQETCHWSIFALTLTFFMSSWSGFIWQASPTLQMVQFPWRLLQIFSFVGAALYATVFSGILKLRLRSRFLLSLVIVGILLMNFRYFYQRSTEYIALRNPGKANVEHLQYTKTIMNDPYTGKLIDVKEYRPLLKNASSSPPVPLIGQPKISVVTGQATINIQQWQSYNRVFSVTTEKPSNIRVRTYYYPAWRIYVNQKPYALSMANDGTIELKLNPGEYRKVLLVL